MFKPIETPHFRSKTFIFSLKILSQARKNAQLPLNNNPNQQTLFNQINLQNQPEPSARPHSSTPFVLLPPAVGFARVRWRWSCWKWPGTWRSKSGKELGKLRSKSLVSYRRRPLMFKLSKNLQKPLPELRIWLRSIACHDVPELHQLPRSRIVRPRFESDGWHCWRHVQSLVAVVG